MSDFLLNASVRRVLDNDGYVELLNQEDDPPVYTGTTDDKSELWGESEDENLQQTFKKLSSSVTGVNETSLSKQLGTKVEASEEDTKDEHTAEALRRKASERLRVNMKQRREEDIYSYCLAKLRQAISNWYVYCIIFQQLLCLTFNIVVLNNILRNVF